VPLTKVFRSGNSQAVRIPKEFQIDATEVIIERSGSDLILRPAARGASGIFEALAALEDMPPRNQPAMQKRPKLR
jgi:antitoxin VapB